METFTSGIAEALSQGGKILAGGSIIEGTEGNFV